MTLPDILLEDESLVAFDKPSGMPVTLGRSDKPGPSLMAAVRERYGPAVANVHRLDPESSGVVLCAKTKPALDFLSGQFQSKTVRKTYHALVVVLTPDEAKVLGSEVRGESGMLPGEFAVELNLGEDEHRPDRVRIFRGRGGKPSATQFKVLEPFGRFAWVECLPLTGRMHQIRVHLASVGARSSTTRSTASRTRCCCSRSSRAGTRGARPRSPSCRAWRSTPRSSPSSTR